jgi:hypothetical protein
VLRMNMRNGWARRCTALACLEKVENHSIALTETPMVRRS